MCILILLTGTFASEYLSANTGGAMIHLLRTMKKGRSHTFGAKLISSSVIAFLLALIFNLIDCIAVFIRFDMPAMSAPLASMTVFENISSVTVGGYLVLFLLLRILAAVMMAMLICAISEILCKSIVPSAVFCMISWNTGVQFHTKDVITAAGAYSCISTL